MRTITAYQWQQRLISRVATVGPVAAIVVFAAVAAPLLVAPILIYSSNVLDFDVSIRHMIPAMIGTVVLVFLVLWLMLLAAPDRYFDRLVSLVLAIALLFWVQGHIVVWDYGVLDGREINWGGQWYRGLIDATMWLGVIVAALAWARQVRAHAALSTTLLIGLEVMTAGYAYTQITEPPGWHRYSVDDTHKFDFSRDRNIILMILDAFQADVMQEILGERPQYYEVFDGFVFYRNAASGYSKTYPSIALMLTGKRYENTVPIQEFLRNAFEDFSVTKPLLEQGWRVDLFPLVARELHFAETVASNVVLRVNAVERGRETGRLLDSALFRSSPHFLKSFWLNNYQWRLSPWFAKSAAAKSASGRPRAEGIHPAVRFVGEIDAYMTSNLDQPAFKMYHLGPPHAPFLLSETLETTRLPSGRTGFKSHSVAALEVTRRMLDRLRALGLYDSTTVIVVSDHGGGDYGVGVNYGLLPEHVGAAKLNDSSISLKHHASALPLVMIKPAEGRGRLIISDAPVSTGDIATTIAALAGVGGSYGGRNVLEIDQKDRRPRRYLFYRFDDWKRDYLPDMVEYELRGHSWLPQNWQATGRVFTPAEVAGRSEAAGYTLGEPVYFRGLTVHSAWFESGWSDPGPSGIWSNRKQAILRIPLSSAPDTPLEARFHLRPFIVENRLPAQVVRVRVNGSPIDKWEVRESGWYRLFLPRKTLNGSKELEFRFELPNAAAPADYGLNFDVRPLGIALIEMQIGSPSYNKPGEAITFGRAGTAQCCISSGWTGSDSGFTWTSGRRAALELVLRDEALRAGRDFVLKARIFPYLARGSLKGQTVRVWTNERQTAAWEVDSEGEYEAPVPARLIEGNRIQIVFEIPGAVAPSAISDSRDMRQLGIGVRTVTIQYAGD